MLLNKMFDKTGDAGSASAAPKLITAFFVKVRVVQSVIFCIVFCQPFFGFFLSFFLLVI
jgi:hypothetical protein